MPRGDDTAHQRVHELIRLGWIFAELRGRHRQRLVGIPHDAPKPRLRRTEYTPPLNYERSVGELDHQTLRVALHLADTLQLNPPVEKIPYHPATAVGTAADTLSALCSASASAQTDEEKKSAWNDLANFLYGWDTYLQDEIVGAASLDSAAYQIGRGLSEAYWALDPDALPDDVRHWGSLLGTTRRAAFRRFLFQVAPSYDSLVISGIVSSLEAWGRVVDNKKAKLSATATAELRTQMDVWRVLLIDHIDPRSLIDSNTALRKAAGIMRLLRIFWPELTAAVVIIVLTILAVSLLPASTSLGARTAIVAVAGFLGITGATIFATVKAIANASIAKLRSALDAEMIRDAVTVIPAQERVRRSG